MGDTCDRRTKGGAENVLGYAVSYTAVTQYTSFHYVRLVPTVCVSLPPDLFPNRSGGGSQGGRTAARWPGAAGTGLSDSFCTTGHRTTSGCCRFHRFFSTPFFQFFLPTRHWFSRPRGTGWRDASMGCGRPPTFHGRRVQFRRQAGHG